MKLVLFSFPQLMWNLCYFRLFPRMSLLLLFTLSYDGSSFKLLQGTPHSFGRNAHVKTFAGAYRNHLGREPTHPVHMREIFAQQIFMHHKTEAYTNHLEREPTHPLHTREIFARQIFMHHKTEDTNFIFEFRRKIECHTSSVYFHFSKSSCSDVPFTLSVSHKPTWFSSCVLPTLLYFPDKFIESVEVHPQKKVSNNGQQVDWSTGGWWWWWCCSTVAPQDLTIAR